MFDILFPDDCCCVIGGVLVVDVELDADDDATFDTMLAIVVAIANAYLDIGHVQQPR